jgi:hypothetical protein
MGGGTVAGAAGAGQGIDWTFGQKGVYDDKTKRKMELLKALIGSNTGTPVNPGDSPGPTKTSAWDPNSIMRLLSFVSGG